MYERLVIWFLEKYEMLRKLWAFFWMTFASVVLLIVLVYNLWGFGVVAFYFAIMMNMLMICFIRSMKEYLLKYTGEKKEYIHDLMWKIIKRRIGL